MVRECTYGGGKFWEVKSIKYEPGDLKELFRELGGLNDVTLMPMLEIIGQRFLKNIVSNPRNYGITDIFWSAGPMSGEMSPVQVVVDQKIIEISLTEIARTTRDIEFTSGKGNLPTIKKMVEALKEFIAKQDLRELRKTTAKELKKEYIKEQETSSVYKAPEEFFSEEIVKFYSLPEHISLPAK